MITSNSIFIMKQIIFLSTISFFLFLSNATSQCSSSKKHHSSYTSKYVHDDLVDIAAASNDFTTLVAAVKAADLVSTLKSEGPFTIFAPNNIAFAKLPEGTVASLLEMKNKSLLTSILTYHVVPANITAENLINSIKAAGGTFKCKTVQGDILVAKIMNGNPVLIDEKGNKSFITKTDVKGSNGVIHVIDSVVMPG